MDEIKCMTLKELKDAISDFPDDATFIVSAMDGTDVIWVRHEERFNTVWITG